MSNKATRSNTDFTHMTIDGSGLTIKNEKLKGDSMRNDEDDEINLEETTMVMNNINSVSNGKLNELTGHDLNDQPKDYTGKQKSTTVEAQLTLSGPAYFKQKLQIF
ncbi:unnamed protein product, partial [Rotaria sp. Silwood2]